MQPIKEGDRVQVYFKSKHRCGSASETMSVEEGIECIQKFRKEQASKGGVHGTYSLVPVIPRRR